jgi:transposase-like protein
MSVLSEPYFHDEAKAYEFVEDHIWANGRSCPFCGSIGNSALLKGKSTRIGLYKCRDCRKPFSVKIGTIFEGSHIPLHVWLQAIALMSASKKGISANQLHRTLSITLKSAWFLAHRIRAAMDPFHAAKPGPDMGGEGKIVEADETYLGKRDGKPSEPDSFISGFGWVSHPKIQTQRKVVALVERGGSVRSFHVDRVDGETVKDVLLSNVDTNSELMTDEAGVYQRPGGHFVAHHTVNHSQDEYVRGYAHTNTIEGYFGVFKRGMKGTYQHCAEKHLHRYLAEFDFRYNARQALGVNDEARTVKALQGIKGKRLTYRTTNRSSVQ